MESTTGTFFSGCVALGLLGPVGAGKGTLRQLLQVDYGFHENSPDMGAIIMEGHNRGDPFLTGLYQDYAIKGLPIPDQLMERVFLDAIKKIPPNNHWVCDGYVRTAEQFPVWLSAVENRGDLPVLIHLKMTLEQSLRRAVPRGRADDTPEKIGRRYRELYERPLPYILLLAEDHGVSVLNIDAGRDLSEVMLRIRTVLYGLGLTELDDCQIGGMSVRSPLGSGC